MPIRGHVTGHLAGVVVSDEEATPAGPTEPLWSISGTTQITEEGANAVYTVSYTGLALGPGATETIVVASANGTATSGADYTALTATMTFTGGGATAKTAAVTIIEDTIVEGTEDFIVTIASPSDGSIAVSQVNTLIVDEDATNLQWSVTGPTSIDEGDSGTYTVSYTGVTLAPGQQATVVVASASGAQTFTDATSGVDYTALSTTLTFTGGGVTTKTVALSTIEDTSVEGTEDFRVTIGGQSIGSLATSEANTVIADDDVGALTLSDVGATTSTSSTIAIHGSAVAGDLAIYCSAALNTSGTPGDVTPPDWEAGPSNVYITTARVKIMAGILTAGDIVAGTITGLSGTSASYGVLKILRPSAPITGLLWVDTAEQGTTGNPSSQTVNASGGTPPLVVCAGFMAAAGATVDPRTWTGSTPASANATSNFYFLHGIFNSSPADITVDMDDEGAFNALQSGFLEVS